MGGQPQRYTEQVKGLSKGRDHRKAAANLGPGLSNGQRRFAMTDQTIHICEPTSHLQQLPTPLDSAGTVNKRDA